jgi:hypothetical protein
MSTTPTTNYSWDKPTVGTEPNQWGEILNANLDSQDADLFAVSNSVKPSAYTFNFDSSIVMVDPGSGDIRLNNANTALATQIAVSTTTANGVLTANAMLRTAPYDELTIARVANGNNMSRYRVVSVADNGTWFLFGVVPSVPFAGSGIPDTTPVFFANLGFGYQDVNDASLKYLATNDTTIDPDPGNVAMNNNAYASVTEIAASVTAFRGTSKNGNWFRPEDIILVNRVGSGASVRYRVVSVINNTTWMRVTVVFISGAGTAFATNDEVAISVRGMSNPLDIAPSDSNYYVQQNRLWVDNSLVRTTNSLAFNWDETLTMADPGPGEIRANNAALNAATQLAISATDFLGTPVASNLYRLKVDDEIMLAVARTGGGATRYVVTAVVNNTTWFLVSVVNIAGAATDPAANDKYVLTMLGSKTVIGQYNGQRLFSASGPALISDAGSVVVKTGAATVVYTVNTVAVTGWLPNTWIDLLRAGSTANSFQIAGTGGVVINAAGGTLSVGPVNGRARLYKSGTSDNWYLSGDLSTTG